jgi:hypothetical protein
MATELIETEENRRTGEALKCDRPAKWAALVEDAPIPLPQRRVKGAVIKAQASVRPGNVLVRDHNSPDDVIVRDEDLIDLAEGNVFYTLAECDVQPREHCSAPPKLALFVNDRPEVTIRSAQTGLTVRELFNLPLNSRLVRDHEGGNDEPIALETTVLFDDGPVFYTRHVEALLSITVNARLFTEADGVRKTMTGREIATLVYPEAPNETRIWLVSGGNREIGLDERIEIQGCEVFDVVRKKVDGGFQNDRIEREVDRMRLSGQHVSLVSSSEAAVIYHDLRAHPGSAVAVTDVLVPVPAGYPGQMIDWAYLPDDSPLIGRVKGNPQDHRITALGRSWRRISYHPHNGGGGPAWNPTLHGFHTYAGELLSWLYNAN